MTIEINDDLLAAFARQNKCEHCNCQGPVEGHHIFSRGLGGGTRLDIPINLIAICRRCHDGYHNRRDPTQAALLRIAARREGVTYNVAVDLMFRLRRDNGGDYRTTAYEVCPTLLAPGNRRSDDSLPSLADYICNERFDGVAIIQRGPRRF